MARAADTTDRNTLVFIDSTSNCDGFGTLVTPVLVETPAGGVPIAISLTMSESQAAYERILRDVASLCSFGGTYSPGLCMHDDARALENAISAVFPTAQQLLCTFHALQAAWTWLHSNVAEQNDRLELLKAVKLLIYTTNEADVVRLYEKLLASGAVKRHPEFRKRLDGIFDRRALFVHAYRPPTVRGHNTNNMAESCMAILKDCVLKRSKVFNAVALVNTLSSSLEDHLKSKLLDFSHTRRRKCFIEETKLLRRVASRNGFDLKPDENGLIKVPSATCALSYYTVDLNTSSCNCYRGCAGIICKHLLAVEVTGQTVVDALLRKTTVASRQRSYFIATGINLPRERFVLHGADDGTTATELPAVDIADPTIVYAMEDTEYSSETVHDPTSAQEIAEEISRLTESQSPETMTKLLKKLKRMTGNQFIGHILAPSRQKRYVAGSKIPTQVHAPSRRKHSKSRARVAVSKGKPAKLGPKPLPTRSHALSKNAQQGTLNAKKH